MEQIIIECQYYFILLKIIENKICDFLKNQNTKVE